MQTGNEKIVYIDRKGFNILEVDDQLLKDLFNQLVRECGNYSWCPSKEEIEELCCETHRRRLYSLHTIYTFRKNLMNEWDNWIRQVNYINNNAQSAFEPYVGGIHMVTPNLVNDWHGQITINTNNLTYSNNNFYTYTNEDLNRLYGLAQNHVENVWEREIHREPRHPDYNGMLLESGEQIHHYRLYIEKFAFNCSNIVDVYINIGIRDMDYLRVDRFYRELQNYIFEYAQICSYTSFMTLSKVIWSNSTLEFNDVNDEIVFMVNELHMGG